mgnify:CR=1 FL=1
MKSVLLGLLFLACQPDQEKRYTVVEIPATPQGTVNASYLALGDSYTIGTAIGVDYSYASMLRDSLEKETSSLNINLEIIAKNGWTTGDLLKALESEKPTSDYNLVSLLIGVNNQYQGRSQNEYRQQFTELLQRAISYAGGDSSRVVVLSIPDWSATPAGAGRREAVGRDIDEFNAINRQITQSYGVAYVDVTPVSRTALNDASLVASDNLHFSAAMHRLWLQLLFEKARKAIHH